MKKQAVKLLLLLLLPLLSACPGDVDPMPASSYSPVLMSRRQLEKSIVKQDPRPISDPGKLYRYGHYILINEKYKGVHVIDNQDPRLPVNLAFIQVPGCIDMAMKDKILYVDNAVDLLAIDLNDLNNIRVTKRVRDALPELLPPDNIESGFDRAGAPADAVIVGWELKKPE
ncbi:hypothetical protein CLV24_10235 [Pontibacter ummariensis]|uniref:LVIVD repeat-containing protein n=1 Tax=Pontibacter ummariensis TaxID=1610492 RepID=A0A239C982_9BACT|nr:hypothetical protein [Pontibacter ummariensis]PRY15414.1 hypothetical protein CLV24_10235 [Pontibacter ummariensis]SNS15923.1 hypothetical protein SAMN06296052_102378 [Pontibacter ummariensis]